jgi:prepilin-type N-terminal cleavage/methylation domain-containing protein
VRANAVASRGTIGSMSVLHRGFTIVELMVVVVVIGILAGLSVNAYNGTQQKARDTKRMNDLRQIESAVESYGTFTGDFSTMSAGASGTEVGWFDNTYSPYVSVLEAFTSAGYLNSSIVDPLNRKVGANQDNYAYMISRCTSGDETKRVIMARLETAPTQTVAQQLSPTVCNDANFTSYTSSTGYRMNYVKLVSTSG